MFSGRAEVVLTEVPDYAWYYGCMGTASGNLMGFWDRHGFPECYTGSDNGGVAPLATADENSGIISMWASKAGRDGRPANEPGHVDDYYVQYESTEQDPYVTDQRPEHAPDCIGDFMGLSQRRWTNMASECSGNIDGYSFVYWATNGSRRVNFVPQMPTGEPTIDVQSGLRAWTRSRGSDAEVFTQLVDFNPKVPKGAGFTFADLKHEIDSGFPVLLFLQDYDSKSRPLSGMPNANPNIHAILAFGYSIDRGTNFVAYRTSWGSGRRLQPWGPWAWETKLPVRGVIGFRPLPKITRCVHSMEGLEISWDAPDSEIDDSESDTRRRAHGYVVEASSSLSPQSFTPMSEVLSVRTFIVPNNAEAAFLRVKLVSAPQQQD